MIPPAPRAQIREVTTGSKPWPMFLTGSVGTGKTYAALCVLERCLFSRVYQTTTEFCERARKADMGDLWSGEYRITLADFWRQWRDADITCLDEIGSRDKVTDHHYETVKRAIDERHMQPAIWISNLTLDQIAATYDDRIASRLSEGTVIEFVGPDLRTAKGA